MPTTEPGPITGPLADISLLGRLVRDDAPLVETLQAVYRRPALTRLVSSVPCGPVTDLERLRWQTRKAEVLSQLADEAFEGTLGLDVEGIITVAEQAWVEVDRLAAVVAAGRADAEDAQRHVRQALGLSVAL